MYRVLLVDDETMLLDSLEVILSLNDMEVIGKAHDGTEALAVLSERLCDIALVDLNMKGMGGIELIGHMKKQYPQIRILVLTTFYDDANITDAISGGADGYLWHIFAEALRQGGQPAPIDVRAGLRMTLPGIYAAESARLGGVPLEIKYPWSDGWTAAF